MVVLQMNFESTRLGYGDDPLKPQLKDILASLSYMLGLKFLPFYRIGSCWLWAIQHDIDHPRTISCILQKRSKHFKLAKTPFFTYEIVNCFFQLTILNTDKGVINMVFHRVRRDVNWHILESKLLWNVQTSCLSSTITIQDFPAGPVLKNLPADTGDMGLIPGLGRSHRPPNNGIREPQLLSPHSSLGSAVREATAKGTRTPPPEKSPFKQQQRPSRVKINNFLKK